MPAPRAASNRSGGNWNAQRSNQNDGGSNWNKGNCQPRGNVGGNPHAESTPTASASTVQGNPKSSGKLFQMEKQAAVDDAHIVTSTFLVNNVPSFILFDSGATHSFVSRRHALALGLENPELIQDSVVIPVV